MRHGRLLVETKRKEQTMSNYHRSGPPCLEIRCKHCGAGITMNVFSETWTSDGREYCSSAMTQRHEPEEA